MALNLERRRRMLGDADPAIGLGVEIGALHLPLLRRDEGRVIYVDYAPTAVLRARLDRPGVEPASLVEVDVVWGDKPLAELIGEKADIVLASHVIEHVPDLIGWLGELHEVLRPGGILGLAIPDRRGTYDAWRSDSTIADVVEAHVSGRRQPGPRQIFEAACLTNEGAADVRWRPDAGGRLPALALDRLADVYRWLRHRAGIEGAGPDESYVDVHCWVFTAPGFLMLAEAMARIGCFAFAVDGFFATEQRSHEFLVRLRSVANSAEPAVLASIHAAQRQVESVADPVLVEALRDLAKAQAELAMLRASRSWRMTRPVRALSRLILPR